MSKSYTVSSARISSIDNLRGLVMILMALDHVRDYFHSAFFAFDPTDLSKTNFFIFFTRWITHFCAPGFFLLAGVAAYLSGQRKSTRELSIFLFKRGAWLVLLELTIVNFSWFFNIHFSFLALQVIWALGWSLVFLGFMIYLPRPWILAIAILLVVGHNLLDGFHIPGSGIKAFLWAVLHERLMFHFGTLAVNTSYPLLPWLGVIALGYCMGEIYRKNFDPARRKIFLFRAGILMVALFLILRWINIYGDLHPWTQQSTPLLSFLSFLNTTKYPPSLDYLLMTTGPLLITLALLENKVGRFWKIIGTYGRVPLFYYVIHIYLVHLLALGAAVLTGYNWTDMIFSGPRNLSPHLKGFGFGLLAVYLVWLIVVIIMYPLCKWYDRYKLEHKDNPWLSYL